MSKPEFYSKYYPDTPLMKGWPFRVRSLGYNRYAPHAKFPSGVHPDDHMFSWESGRILPTVTLVHVVRGKGSFRSHPSGLLPMTRNSVLFVYPQIRHAYCPDARTGWDDQWIELNPEYALPLMKQAGVTPESPIKTLEAAPRLSQLFQELFDLSRVETFGVEQELAASVERIHPRESHLSTCLELVSCGRGYDVGKKRTHARTCSRVRSGLFELHRRDFSLVHTPSYSNSCVRSGDRTVGDRDRHGAARDLTCGVQGRSSLCEAHRRVRDHHFSTRAVCFEGAFRAVLF